jgi:membrane associated rhomboid family serine protease
MNHNNIIDKKQLFLLSIYFLLMPFLLISIFLFSDSLNQILSLYTNNPTILSVIGSNYLHIDIPHLASNIFAYLLVVPFVNNN